MKDNSLVVKEDQPTVIADDPMLSMIDRVCSDPNFDVSKFEKMVEMRNAEFARLAKIEFNIALSEMQPKLPRIVSVHHNTQTKSNYSKLEDINLTILPILSQHGFGVSFAIVKQDDQGVTVRASVKHTGGHEDSTELFMPYDKAGIQGTVNKTNIHATGSTITYAKRYALCMLLNISTGTDTDGSLLGLRRISDETAAQIKQSLKDTDSDVKKFLDYMGVDCVENIMTKDFERANMKLVKKVRLQQEEKPLFREVEEATI